jgi:hypothetical protein
MQKVSQKVSLDQSIDEKVSPNNNDNDNNGDLLLIFKKKFCHAKVKKYKHRKKKISYVNI